MSNYVFIYPHDDALSIHTLKHSSSETNHSYMLKTLLFAYSQKYFVFDGPATASWDELFTLEFLILHSPLTFASEMLWSKAVVQYSVASSTACETLFCF